MLMILLGSLAVILIATKVFIPKLIWELAMGIIVVLGLVIELWPKKK